MTHPETPTNPAECHRMRLGLLCGMIVITIATRCMPHPWNFTPLGAVALFSGATLSSRWLSILVPMIAVVVSDLIIGLHWLMPAVYACLLFNVWLGGQLAGRRRPLLIGGAATISAVVFFLVTNFACWAMYYEHSPAGLATCYALAVPYFGATLGGDLVFSAALFGSLALLEQCFPQLRPVKGTASH